MSELSSRLAEALGASYRIERELGGGGMSRVFLAEEVALARKVVVKVLPPEMAAGVNQDRFRREVQLAARLQHPHVVPLLSAGSSNDLLWYVMPFIDGESLRVKLAREGELPVHETVRILREVVDALAYAHEQGVVHRDIKPDNVMLSRGHALVTDFGVAKAVSESSGGQSLTSLGVALGTPAYMSPEQASGDPHVDHRADLYSLGALAYEMLAGRPPFVGGSPQSMLAAHVTQTPDRLSAHRPSVPPALEQIVMRCLEKRAADRWQTSKELLPHLDALLTPSGGTQPTTAHTISSGTEAALRKAHPARVAGLFAVVALAVLSLAYWAVQRFGLPNWVVPAAGVLLVIGLPIMLMTARRERERLRLRTTGHHVVPPSGLAGRLFTWRGALGGGAIALGGLVAGTGAFMALRAMGVGPFATLVSAGVLGERDKLVLADFANRTSDSTLGASITEAFRIDLTRSPVVRLLESNEVATTLRQMRRNPDEGMNEAVAREVAQRTGAKAIVSGDVVPLGSGYVLTARLVSAGDSSTLVAERETAADAGALIPAVERLSKKVRERIGESLRTIRAGQPLDQVTTSSLAALRAYSEGSRLQAEGRGREGLTFLRQAVTLDSTFGMAWRRIAVILWNNQINRAAMVDAATRAYRLADRMPPHEAAHATAFYFQAVTNDDAKAAAAYESLLANWPDDGTAINNLSVMYNIERRDADAENLIRRAIAIQPTSAIYLGNLVEALVLQNKLAEADSVTRDWGRHSPSNLFRYRQAVHTAREAGQFDRALILADSAQHAEGAGAHVVATQLRGEMLRYTGRYHDAERATREVMALNEGNRDAEAYLSGALDLFWTQAFIFGKADAAVASLDAAIARFPLDSIPADRRPYGDLVAAYAYAGRLPRAQAFQAAYERAVPQEEREAEPTFHLGAGHLALSRNDGRTAVGEFRAAATRFLCRICTSFEQGVAFEKLSLPDSAIASYETLVNGRSMEDDSRSFLMAAALRRLGELYESKGDRTKAIEYYGRFVDLWKNADAELQPVVKDVRKRMAELAGEPGRQQG